MWPYRNARTERRAAALWTTLQSLGATVREAGGKRESGTMTLTELRIAAGLSQAQLAKCVGVSQATISRWETANVITKTDKLSPVSKALGVEIQDVIWKNCLQVVVTSRARRVAPHTRGSAGNTAGKSNG